MFEEAIKQIKEAETVSYTGKIENIVGMSIEASGGRAAVGDICQIYNGSAGGGTEMCIRDRYLLATGQLDNPAELTIAQTQAAMSVELLVQLRNKALDAYSELMRISM